MKTSNNVQMNNVQMVMMMNKLQVEVLYVVLLQKEVIVQPPPPDNRNEIMDPNANEITTLYLNLALINDSQLLPLEHCPCLELFYYNPDDVRDFLDGYKWLDVGILQVWCT